MPDEINQAANTRFELAESLQEQLMRLMRHLRTVELPDGMTPERFSAMTTIDKRGPISVTALADNEFVRPASMSRMVAALVDEGLVQRTDDADDGRGVLLRTTRKGRRSCQRAKSQRLQHFAEVLETLNDEQVAAMRSLVSVLARLTFWSTSTRDGR